MRIPEWTASRQEVEDGEDVGVVYVVKDERRDLYVKLSERGYELWTEMDGQTSVRELVMDGFVRHGELALEQTLDLVQTLRTAGFVTTHRVAPAAPPPHTQPWYRRVVNFIGRIVGVIGRLLSFRFKIRRVDHWVGVLYRGGFHLLFRKEVQALLALFVASGLAWAGFLYFTDALPPVEPVSGLGWVGLYLFVILLSFAHELAHALTAKAAGREIREAGFQVRIGVPLVYLDTSDVWMASRKTRVAVSWAGPYFHLVVAAVVAWVLGVTPRLRESDALVGTLALNFTLFAANMFPLRELDGYYMLLDWFEAPRLRRKALSFLGLQSRKREPVRAWGKLERVYGAFGLVSAVYTLFLATQLLVGLQRTIGRIVGSVIDPTVGTGLGWLVGIVAGALFYLPSVQDLLRGRSADD